MQGYPKETAASKCQHIIDDGFVELNQKRCLEQCRLWPAIRVAESEILRLVILCFMYFNLPQWHQFILAIRA